MNDFYAASAMQVLKLPVQQANIPGQKKLHRKNYNFFYMLDKRAAAFIVFF